jgi:hypothetical protein
MLDDGRGRMLWKRPGLAKNDDAVFTLPVPVHTPPITFVRMAPESLSAELEVDVAVTDAA